MPELYLSRVELRRDASANALISLLLPAEADQRLMVTHKLLWTLFATDAAQNRDFLWREAEPGHFLILSHRPPEDPHHLFMLSPPKPFAPDLRAGDRLGFSLRANPTIAVKAEKDAKGNSKRADVVMHALRDIPPQHRAEKRQELIQSAGTAWLEQRAAKHGFALEQVTADRYTQLAPPHRGAKMRISTLDYNGRLKVTDPSAFLAMLACGLGRAKAYGCGLMLIRRV